MKLKPIGPHGHLYRKHFIHLGGLGIRDLCAQGSDLLILAGPTMSLEGPVHVFRWRGGAEPKGESMVPLEQLDHLLDVSYGRDVGHAEGMTLFSANGGPADSLMVIYDSIPKKRQSAACAVTADLFPLPNAIK